MMKRVVLGLLLLLIGGWLTFGLAQELYQVWASRGWPEVQGTVRASSVETKHSKGSDSLVPRVRYDYTVGAEHYTSNRFSPSIFTLRNASEAREFESRYRVGTSVPVHYSPDEPQLACLECGAVNIGTYGVLVVVLGTAVIGGWSLLNTLVSYLAVLRHHRRGGRRATPGDA